MFDNENEKLNNPSEENVDAQSAPEVDTIPADDVQPETEPDMLQRDENAPVTAEISYDGSSEEILDLGFGANRNFENGTPTYYKKKNKKISVVAACVISVVATLILVACSFAVYHFAVDNFVEEITPPFSNETSKSPSKASTLEQLAKKEGAEMSVVDIANKVGPAVCGIVVTQEVPSFFGTQLAQGSGSGIIISEDGYIVTNQHVIEGASEIKVILSSGQEYTAELVGQDVSTDLAVIKVEGEKFPVAELGYSSELEVGELAIAIGNPLGQEFAGSVTVGVISALNRSVSLEDRSYTLIQTDAAINSGNSGGALVNSFGQVVGINSLKIAQAEGLSFAIPIDTAKPIIDDLIANGYVKGRPVIGVTLREVDSAMSQQYSVPEGLYVVAVTEFGAAEKAGILQGDVIIEADGQKVSTVEELNNIKNQKKAGDTLKLKIKRSQNMNFMSQWSEKTIDVVLDEETPTP